MKIEDDESIEKCTSYLEKYPEEKDHDIQVIKKAFRAISKENIENHTQLIESLKAVQTKYDGRNMKDFFNQLIECLNK